MNDITLSGSPESIQKLLGSSQISKNKKPFYRRGWFWVSVIFFGLFVLIGLRWGTVTIWLDKVWPKNVEIAGTKRTETPLARGLHDVVLGTDSTNQKAPEFSAQSAGELVLDGKTVPESYKKEYTRRFAGDAFRVANHPTRMADPNQLLEVAIAESFRLTYGKDYISPWNKKLKKFLPKGDPVIASSPVNSNLTKEKPKSAEKEGNSKAPASKPPTIREQNTKGKAIKNANTPELSGGALIVSPAVANLLEDFSEPRKKNGKWKNTKVTASERRELLTQVLSAGGRTGDVAQLLFNEVGNGYEINQKFSFVPRKSK